VWLIGGLLLAVCCGYMGLPTAGDTSSTASIEEIGVMQNRVLADNPETPGQAAGAFGEIEPERWRLVELRMAKAEGGSVQIELARPAWWLEEEGVAVGEQIDLDLPEFGVTGDAEVLAISPCPQPNEGDGRVVTGKFVHEASNLLDLTIENVAGPLGVTANHPFWSEDRQAFVPAGELREGELLLLAEGNPTRLLTRTQRPGIHRVYNLEVDGEHVYYVGAEGVLVHNMCAPRGTAALEQPRNVLGQFMSRTRPGQAIPGATAVDDFAAQAQRNGFDVLGREVSVMTPFGRRKYDLVIQDRTTGAVTGVEIKSSLSSFKRFDEPARHQFAADRYLRTSGGL